jgi:hypothetical protein
MVKTLHMEPAARMNPYRVTLSEELRCFASLSMTSEGLSMTQYVSA